MSYGAWINPEGETIEVPNKLEHRRVCDYGDAHNEGWVGIIHGSAILDMTITPHRHYGMAMRFNPKTITSKAIKALIKMIAQSDQESFILEDSFTNGFEGFGQSVDKRSAKNALRQLHDGGSPFKNMYMW